MNPLLYTQDWATWLTQNQDPNVAGHAHHAIDNEESNPEIHMSNGAHYGFYNDQWLHMDSYEQMPLNFPNDTGFQGDYTEEVNQGGSDQSPPTGNDTSTTGLTEGVQLGQGLDDAGIQQHADPPILQSNIEPAELMQMSQDLDPDETDLDKIKAYFRTSPMITEKLEIRRKAIANWLGKFFLDWKLDLTKENILSKIFHCRDELGRPSWPYNTILKLNQLRTSPYVTKEKRNALIRELHRLLKAKRSWARRPPNSLAQSDLENLIHCLRSGHITLEDNLPEDQIEEDDGDVETSDGLAVATSNNDSGAFEAEAPSSTPKPCSASSQASTARAQSLTIAMEGPSASIEQDISDLNPSLATPLRSSINRRSPSDSALLASEVHPDLTHKCRSSTSEDKSRVPRLSTPSKSLSPFQDSGPASASTATNTSLLTLNGQTHPATVESVITQTTRAQMLELYTSASMDRDRTRQKKRKYRDERDDLLRKLQESREAVRQTHAERHAAQKAADEWEQKYKRLRLFVDDADE